MLVMLQNGFTLFVPVIFPSKETLETWPSFRLLYAAELSIIILTLPGVMLLVRALGNSIRLFHRNLIRIMQVHLIAVTLSEVSRLSAILYEARIVKKSENAFDLLVFVTVAVRFASLCSLLTMIPAMITERVFASRLISDYERLPRPWISVLINVAAIVLATSYYALSMLACLSTFYVLGLTILSVLIMALSSVAIVVVHRSDIAILRDLTNKTGVSQITYTLSLKFQLEENVRVTKILVYLSIGYSAWGFFGCCLSAAAFIFFDSAHPLGHLSYALFNNYIALSFAILVWWLLWAVGELRRLVGVCFTSWCWCPCNIEAKQSDFISNGNPGNSHRIDDHFTQLHSAWAF